ncbi:MULTISPECIES: hypothetical protein [Halorhodospira]|uniref:hypothetical protein n=1 Tax=Halorhodospira TaxID=85108 RepID=UPI001914736B|nr:MULTISPECIES: hypothetical protein [Halorhodospira]MBK5937108.1 hypothetical protein [Halorhodospira halophila]MBK5943188.1 hypothetical protein [Halorhodospira halophila]MCG5528700.1 hypothetical protein [Halorhodospira halophila]MCG5533903.1 hypothetical protein [Halorhodospira sp. 9621]MCG5539047.1 hypothetical protein [Halorhodospira sp. 9622]
MFLWLLIAAVLAAIDLGARPSSLQGGYLLAAAIGALAAALASLALGDAHQFVIALLVGAAAARFLPPAIQRRERHRLKREARDYTLAEVDVDEDGIPCVQPQGEDTPLPAMLEDRGELTAGDTVWVLRVEQGVAIVRSASGRRGRVPPPLSRCRWMR